MNLCFSQIGYLYYKVNGVENVVTFEKPTARADLWYGVDIVYEETQESAFVSVYIDGTKVLNEINISHTQVF